MAEPIEPPAPDFGGASLSELMRYADGKSLPPVDAWNPDHCGTSEMRIAADGTWFHQGSPVGRSAMVRLFSTVLRREPDGRHVLVTPVEKLDIEVEDAPFIAVEVRSEGEGQERNLAFRLNTGDIVAAGAHHPIWFEQHDDGPHPYLHVRGTLGNGLNALIVRSVYYELVQIGIDGGENPPAIWSGGKRFPLAPAG